MPEIIDFPRGLAARVINLRLINRTRSSQESLSGFTQVAASIAQRWGLTLEFNTLKAEYVPAYRAILAALEGRTNWLRVPITDRRFTKAPAAGIDALMPHSDGSTFDDGTLYTMDDVSGIVVSSQRGEKSLEVDFGDYGQALDAGLYFGIADDLYIATSVVWTGNVAAIRCQPGLRRDYDAASFKLHPTLICQLSADEVGDHPLEWGIRTSPTLDVVEVL